MAIDKIITSAVQKGVQNAGKASKLTGIPVQNILNSGSSVPAAKLSKRETIMAQNILKQIGICKDKNLMDTFVGRFGSPLQECVSNTRNLFVQAAESVNVSQKTLKEIKKAKTWGELQAAIYNFENQFYKYEINPILNKVPKHTNGISLEIEQMFYEKFNTYGDCVRYLHGLFASRSTNPEVVAIEKILGDEFGVHALLNNDLAQAKDILKAVKLAKLKGIDYPKEFIISNYKSGGEHLRVVQGSESSVLLGANALTEFRSKCVKPVTCTSEAMDIISRWFNTSGFKGWYSTDLPEHKAMHEILHKHHYPFLAFKLKRIPKKFTDTINRLSGYAASKPKSAHEVYTELNAKRVLTGLNSEEQELFKFLGGQI